MGCLLDKAVKVAEAIKDDVDMTQGRRDTLVDVMVETCDQVVREVIQLNKWRDTDTTRKLEADIVKVQHDVLAGRGKLIDFQQACQRWKAAGTRGE